MTNAVKAVGRLEWQALALLLVVFVAGAALGATGMRMMRLPPQAFGPPMGGPDGPPNGPPNGPPGGAGAPGRLPPYVERLGLSEEQHQKIKVILDRQRPKVDVVLESVLPRLRALSDSTISELRAVLTSAQREQFDRERPQRALAPGMPRLPGGPGGPEGGPPPPRERP